MNHLAEKLRYKNVIPCLNTLKFFNQRARGENFKVDFGIKFAR
jgi:hypothetical protein